LSGLRVLVSAGPICEDIDPVRFIGNRSSGRMGFAIAQAAVAQGADVHLVAGPVHLPTPPGVSREDVRSARAMRDAVMRQIPQCDIFISAAAVGDYRPMDVAAHKLKKTGKALVLELTENPDIVAQVAALKKKPFVAGFAAETENLERHARIKLERKKLDLIAANRVGNGAGFDADDNALTLLWPGGKQVLAKASKHDLANALLARIVRLRAKPVKARRR